MLRRWALLAVVALTGCGTIADMVHEQRIYGGTQEVFSHVDERVNCGPCAEMGPFWLLDLPCSLVADTVLLPYTVGKAVLGRPTSDSSP